MRVHAIAALLSFPLVAQVTSERIRNSAREPGNWLTYSGNYRGYRYSPLDQINTQNVARLKPVWMYQINDLNQFETTPLVVDGVVYISEPPSNATALDARTGRPLWAYRRTPHVSPYASAGATGRIPIALQPL